MNELLQVTLHGRESPLFGRPLQGLLGLLTESASLFRVRGH